MGWRGIIGRITRLERQQPDSPVTVWDVLGGEDPSDLTGTQAELWASFVAAATACDENDPVEVRLRELEAQAPPTPRRNSRPPGTNGSRN